MSDTADSIMALAEECEGYAVEKASFAYSYESSLDNLLQARAALRDAIERVIQERDEAHATMKRWQSCGGCVGTFCKADALLARAEKAEQEVAALKALLKELRQIMFVEDGLRPDYGWGEYVALVDAATKEGK